jgi:polyhydroxybutyrate depolymerase
LLSETLNIDPGRRYFVGISNGGFMAQRIACDTRVRCAAFASVGAGRYAALPENCRRRAPHLYKQEAGVISYHCNFESL